MSRKTFLKLRKNPGKYGGKKPKIDRVARYQAFSNEWKSSKFLSGKSAVRKKQIINCYKAQPMHRTIPKAAHQTYVAPTEKRRDDLKFKLRTILQGKDFNNSNMREFYYNPNANQPLKNQITEEQRIQLEQIKKLIE